MNATALNFQRLCELAEARTKGQRNFSFAPDYAEPGYSSPERGIVFGNWNPVCGFGKTKAEQKRDPVSKLARVLEHFGFECEWEDEWSICADCGKAIRTKPDSYGWTSYYRIVNEREIVCLNCLDKAEYLAECEDDPNNAFPPEWSPQEFGYTKYNGDFETGLLTGQNDDPEKLIAQLHKEGKRHVVFRIKSKGQFDLTWEAYYKEEKDNE